MTAAAPHGGEPVDGRSARRARNRDAVLDAVHELFTEGRTFPTLESVAARSGVSLRSIHRYFPDSQGLMVEALARRVGLTAPLFELPRLGEGTLEERIEAVVDQRLTIYEHSSATIRVSLGVADSMPLIATQVERRLNQLAAQLRGQFARELGAMPAERASAVLTCIEVLTHFEALDFLHRQGELTRGAIRETLVEGMRVLLGVARAP